jgi:hypothetical protein
MEEGFGAKRFRKRVVAATGAVEEQTQIPSGNDKLKKRGRVSKEPLVVVAQSPDKAAAEAGLERWKAAHAEAAGYLAVEDVLVDRMRGASTIWYRIRVNLRHVPEGLRPVQGVIDPDDGPTRTDG